MRHPRKEKEPSAWRSEIRGVLGAINRDVYGTLIGIGILRFIWNIGFISFIGNRIIAPAIISIVVGYALFQITGEPLAETGDGAAISLVTILLGRGETAA
ncbi:MAG: hypothetical protein AAF702_28965 [Chloroflexota bacterium]